MNWPLNKNNFHFIDRVRMALFFLNPSKRWTRGKLTKKLEEEACEYFGCKYSVFVSSGSTANTVLAMYLKDLL